MVFIKIIKDHKDFVKGQSFPATNKLAQELINAKVAIPASEEKHARPSQTEEEKK